MRVLLLIGSVLLVLAACSPEQRYSVLSVIFDGVPRPGETPDETTRVSPQFIGLEAARAPSQLRLFRHQPALDDRCDNCHPPDRLWLGETFDRDGGCFTCHEHDVFQAKLTRYSFLHGPVAVQACLACHDPHDSPYEGLLVQPDPRLCHGCHDRQSLLSSPAHEDQSTERCLECHDPHGGTGRYFLKAESEL